VLEAFLVNFAKLLHPSSDHKKLSQIQQYQMKRFLEFVFSHDNHKYVFEEYNKGNTNSWEMLKKWGTLNDDCVSLKS